MTENELLSTKTCMECGQPGEMVEENKWLSIICNKCKNK